MLKRTCLILSLVLLVLMVTLNSSMASDAGQDKKIVIRYSFVQQMTTPTGRAGTFLKEYLEEKSGGRVTMEIFSDGQLYTDETEVDALVSGNIDMISPYVGKLIRVDPKLAVLTAPYVFDDGDSMFEFMQTPKYNAVICKKLNNLGLSVLGLQYGGGTAWWSPKKMFMTLEDFKGMKIRDAGASQITNAIYQSVGGSSVTVAFNDLYMAMQTGMMDMGLMSLESAVPSKMQEAAKYCVQAGVSSAPYFIMFNTTIFRSYPEDVQQMILDGLKLAGEYQYITIQAQVEECKQLIVDEGVQYYELTETEKKVFKDAWFPIIAQNADPDIWKALSEFYGR